MEPTTGTRVTRRRRPATVRDMVLSLAVIFGAVAAVLLLAPQSPPVEQPSLTRADALAVAEAEAPELGFLPSVPDPGAGWEVSYARAETVQEGVRQWRVGYLSPDGRRIDLEQGVEVDGDWVLRPDEGNLADPEPAGPDVPPSPDGWRPVVRGGGDVALVAEDAVPPTGSPGVVTVVSTDSDWAIATQVARSAPMITLQGG